MKCDIDDPTKSDSGHYRKDTNRISNYNTHGCNNKTNFVNIHNNHGAGDEYRHREIPHFSQVRHSRFHAISRVIRCRSVDVENTTPVITLVGYASPTLPDVSSIHTTHLPDVVHSSAVNSSCFLAEGCQGGMFYKMWPFYLV